jgi:FKBP-type peptidyl-prolyl cis-trans isomerase FkpA
MMIRKLVFVLVGCMLLGMAALAADSTKTDTKAAAKETMKKADEKPVKVVGKEEMKESATEPEWTTTNSGLKYRDITIGVGDGAKVTDRVETHYTVWVADGMKKGAKIQSSKDTGQPFPFTVGQPGLIKGWNEGMVGMKPGGVRELIVPPDLGWGAKGMPPTIPANATVYFQIELLKNISQERAAEAAKDTTNKK